MNTPKQPRIINELTNKWTDRISEKFKRYSAHQPNSCLYFMIGTVEEMNLLSNFLVACT